MLENPSCMLSESTCDVDDAGTGQTPVINTRQGSLPASVIFALVLIDILCPDEDHHKEEQREQQLGNNCPRPQ